MYLKPFGDMEQHERANPRGSGRHIPAPPGDRGGMGSVLVFGASVCAIERLSPASQSVSEQLDCGESAVATRHTLDREVSADRKACFE